MKRRKDRVDSVPVANAHGDINRPTPSRRDCARAHKQRPTVAVGDCARRNLQVH